MLTKSKPPQQMRRIDFAKRLQGNFAAVWIDRIASLGTFPLECMKVGTVPISLVPDVTPEYIIKDNKVIENCGVWTDDFFQLPILIADTIRKFLDDEITDDIYLNMKEITEQYTPEISKKQILNIYSNLLEERKLSLTKALEKLQ
jgi:glycosyltransferase involved in cell wall biosynthesis